MIKPLYDRVLLEKKEAEKKTASGIILPESKERPSMAKVIAVGPGKLNDKGDLIPVDVKVGDTVIYKQYATTEVKDNDKEYLIVEMKDILAVVE